MGRGCVTRGGRKGRGKRETQRQGDKDDNMEEVAKGQIAGVLQATVKTSAFTPSKTESHWKALSTQ